MSSGADRSARANDREPLANRRVGETVVERHERQRLGLAFGCHDRCRKLERVGRAERMNEEQSPREPSKGADGSTSRQAPDELVEAKKAFGPRTCIQRALALQPRER